MDDLHVLEIKRMKSSPFRVGRGGYCLPVVGVIRLPGGD
jgi:hypothetical protein